MIKKIILGIVGFFILVGIIGAATGGGDKSSSDITKVGEEKQEAQKPTETQQEIFKIGDKVKRGDAVLTVTKVDKDWKSSNQFDKPQNPNYVYVVVTVTVENQGTKDMSLSGFWDFKLEDSRGVQGNEALGGIGLNKLSSTSVSSLSPSGKITGDLVFAAPKDATDRLILHYKPLISFGKPAKIELQ